MLEPVLDDADADGWPCYLESSNPRNVSLYLRHGFVETGELPLPDGPSLTQMWREPGLDPDPFLGRPERRPYDVRPWLRSPGTTSPTWPGWPGCS